MLNVCVYVCVSVCVCVCVYKVWVNAVAAMNVLSVPLGVMEQRGACCGYSLRGRRRNMEDKYAFLPTDGLPHAQVLGGQVRSLLALLRSGF